MAEIAPASDVSIMPGNSDVVDTTSSAIKTEQNDSFAGQPKTRENLSEEVTSTSTPVQKKRRQDDAPSTVKKTQCKKKKQEYTSVLKTLQGVKGMVQAWGYKDPDAASMCTLAGLARGVVKVDFEAKLEGVAWEGSCIECNTGITVRLRALLDQADYGDDYEDGSEGGAAPCPNTECGFRYYVTGMCAKKPNLDCGKFHNHCKECKGFGRCIGDYRNSHCGGCGKHYFQGLSGFGCPKCSGRRGGRGGGDGECSIM